MGTKTNTKPQNTQKTFKIFPYRNILYTNYEQSIPMKGQSCSALDCLWDFLQESHFKIVVVEMIFFNATCIVLSVTCYFGVNSQLHLLSLRVTLNGNQCLVCSWVIVCLGMGEGVVKTSAALNTKFFFIDFPQPFPNYYSGIPGMIFFLSSSRLPLSHLSPNDNLIL